MPEGTTGELKTAGGVLRATVLPGEGRKLIRSVRFSGDVVQTPEGALLRLEEALAGATIDQAPAKIEEYFAANPDAIGGANAGDFLTVLTLAFMKALKSSSTAPDPAAWKKQV
jgi:hypothetical protein